MHLRRDYRDLLIISASILFALILSYFMFPAFSAFMDKYGRAGYEWAKSRILNYFP